MTALEQKQLSAELARIQITESGDLVEDLKYEFNAQDEPRLIRGILRVPGANGMRSQPTTWLPNGRHRLYPSLNLSFPLSQIEKHEPRPE